MSPDTAPTTYRHRFAGAAEVAAYDADEYGPGTYASVLWELEKDQLAAIVAGLRRTHGTIDYLDFAAGTGRIISFLETRVDSATGLEISPAMAARAQTRLTRGRMVCADITQEGVAVDSVYDLITAYRFVLNAEPALRVAALRALATRLRDERSLLIFNNHGNLWSAKLATYPLRRLRGQGAWWPGGGNVMSNAQARRLATQAGLEIVTTLGCGILGGRLSALLPRGVVGSIERTLADRRLLARLGVNQTYVTRLRGSGLAP